MDLIRTAFGLWARRGSETSSQHFENDTPTRSDLSISVSTSSEVGDHSHLIANPLPASSAYAAMAVDEDPCDDRNEYEEDDDDSNSSCLGLLPSQYHREKPLPPEIKEHCRVYLEEALPRQAIFLLDSLLSTRVENPDEPTYCPPPSQVSLLLSIVVHPDFTTRPREPDWPEISLQALTYLQNLLAVLGPINAGFKESVLFGTNVISEFDTDTHNADDIGIDADERGLVRLSPRHGSDSVWQRGRDFFSVVGWAFNCSFLYPERWQWWHRWLNFMLQLLDADLNERHRLDTKNESEDMPLLQGSILASYINQRSGRTNDVTMWIMKALFADGDTASMSVFQEVWHRERKSKLRHTPNKRKRDKVNIENGEYGGYLDDESVHSSQASEPPTPQKNRGMRSSSVGEEEIGSTLVETIRMRQRLFSMVSFLCYRLGDASPIDFSNLYQKFEQRIKELPFHIFSSFVNTSTSALRIDQQIEMLQGVLFLFLPPGALSPRRVDRARFDEGGISPTILERCFLPYPANTVEVEDQAKMSLLLENLLMIVWLHADEEDKFSGEIRAAVDKGIEARWAKINKKKTPRGRGKPVPDNMEPEARAALKASDLRLVWLADAINESIHNVAGGEEMEEDRDV